MSLEELLEINFKRTIWGGHKSSIVGLCSCGKNYTIKTKFESPNRLGSLPKRCETICPRCGDLSYVEHEMTLNKDHAVMYSAYLVTDIIDIRESVCQIVYKGVPVKTQKR